LLDGLGEAIGHLASAVKLQRSGAEIDSGGKADAGQTLEKGSPKVTDGLDLIGRVQARHLAQLVDAKYHRRHIDDKGTEQCEERYTTDRDAPRPDTA